MVPINLIGVSQYVEIRADDGSLLLGIESKNAMNLAWVINSSSRLQGRALDRLQLHYAIGKYQSLAKQTNEDSWRDHLTTVAMDLGIEEIDWYMQPDRARLPAIAWVPDSGWSLIRALMPNGRWLTESQAGLSERASTEFDGVGRLVLAVNEARSEERGYVKSLFKNAFYDHKKIFIEGAIAGVMINIIALGTSLYSMQIYDRVVPTQGYATLIVLAIGTLSAIIFELMFKIIRSYLLEHAVADIDNKLSREIFSRLLQVRLDQLPGSVGSLSAQIRGYETIRAFLSTSTFYVLIDIPFGVVFIFLIALIGGWAMALVPFIFLIFSVAIGIVMRQKIEHHTKQATAAANLKTGLLVEAIEGAETIKSGGGGWHTLSNWLDVVKESMLHDSVSKSIHEKSSYFAATLQQISYIGIVSVGAYFAAEGQLTMGSLVACSILSGRILAPIAQIPGVMASKAHAKAALDGLESLFKLETDNHNIDRPLTPNNITGKYSLERVRFSYPTTPRALLIPKLEIQAGEKIGIVGPIGSGKSTLLRLLTGMYQANEGRIHLDGLDIYQVSRDVLVDKIGYLQQDHRLFSGTLRQNILIGIPDPGDEAIYNAASRSGLLATIGSHPKGLDLLISEGGKGLSGGQRQLVALTRVLLSRPKIWLLDEPTASLDEKTERQFIGALLQAIKPDDTLVIVTHKLSLLNMVNRLIVIANGEIALDGPSNEILLNLNQPKQAVQSNSNIAGGAGNT